MAEGAAKLETDTSSTTSGSSGRPIDTLNFGWYSPPETEGQSSRENSTESGLELNDLRQELISNDRSIGERLRDNATELIRNNLPNPDTVRARLKQGAVLARKIWTGGGNIVRNGLVGGVRVVGNVAAEVNNVVDNVQNAVVNANQAFNEGYDEARDQTLANERQERVEQRKQNQEMPVQVENSSPGQAVTETGENDGSLERAKENQRKREELSPADGLVARLNPRVRAENAAIKEEARLERETLEQNRVEARRKEMEAHKARLDAGGLERLRALLDIKNNFRIENRIANLRAKEAFLSARTEQRAISLEKRKLRVERHHNRQDRIRELVVPVRDFIQGFAEGYNEGIT